MKSSIRNEIAGTIASITIGNILAEIIVDTPSGKIVSIITARSAKDMALAVGDEVCAQIKATNISLCKCDCGKHGQ